MIQQSLFWEHIQKISNQYAEEYLHSHVDYASFITAKIWKELMCPPMDKENVTHSYIHSRISLSLQKGNQSFATMCMNLEDMLHEISQPYKDKYCYDLIYVSIQNLKKLNSQKYREQKGGYQRLRDRELGEAESNGESLVKDSNYQPKEDTVY